MEPTKTLNELLDSFDALYSGGVWKTDTLLAFQAVGRYLAEDVEGTDLKMGHRIVPEDVGTLAANGKLMVNVWFKPYVTILSTGIELVTPFEMPGEGQRRDSNSMMLQALAEDTGAVVVGVDMINEGQAAVDVATRNFVDQCDVVIVTTSLEAGAEQDMLTLLDSIRKPGVIAYGSTETSGGNIILAALKDEYCRCEGRMPALIVALPGSPETVKRNYDDVVDYFIRKYYFHNI